MKESLAVLYSTEVKMVTEKAAIIGTMKELTLISDENAAGTEEASA